MVAPDSSARAVDFDLGSIEQELRQEAAYWREGHTARTLVLAPDLRVVLITIKGGSRIAEHDSNESATLHAISGHLRIRLRDRTVELRARKLLILGPGLKRDIEAVADSTFVLTLGWTLSAGADIGAEKGSRKLSSLLEG